MSGKAAAGVPIEASRSGIYRAPARVDAVQKATGKAGMQWIELPLQAVSDKKQFLAACAKQLKFPSHFGGNWDALADCVHDLSWLNAKGYVLHASGSEKFSKSAPGDYQSALDVLSEAAAFWKAKGTPFVVLVDAAKDLPAF